MENGKASRAPVIVSAFLISIFGSILVYTVCSYFWYQSEGGQTRHRQSFALPRFSICGADEKAEFFGKREKRDTALIKRVARPLSAVPPFFTFGGNNSYDPPLYHDAGAKCAWGHISKKRVPNVEDVSYDSQKLGARQCDDLEICKSICLRIHQPDDPYLCNYFTWNREKKLALFYFLEPTLKWNLTQDDQVETFFWQCKETSCSWYLRPHRILAAMADMTATQLRNAHGLVAVNQCTDFATCQFSCETRPSFRELLEQGQAVPENVYLDDPTCDYIVMPSTDTKTQFSFLFSMRQAVLKNSTFIGIPNYDSFELICKNPIPTAVNPGAASIVVAAPPTQRRPLSKRQAKFFSNSDPFRLRNCKRANESIDCSKLISDKADGSKCVRMHGQNIGLLDQLSFHVEAEKAVWFFVEHPNGLNEKMQLTPGFSYALEIISYKNADDDCGRKNEQNRKCAAVCNDQMAIDACGCSINSDAEMIAGDTISVAPCDENQFRSCVINQLRSDDFFDCMNQCKSECVQRPVIKNFEKINSTFAIYVELSARTSASSVEAKPLSLNSPDAEHFIQMWAPVLILAMLLPAIVICTFSLKNCY